MFIGSKNWHFFNNVLYSVINVYFFCTLSFIEKINFIHLNARSNDKYDWCPVNDF